LVHRQDRYLYLFEQAGITVESRTPVFFIPEAAKDKVKKDLAPLKREFSFLVAINPSANWKLKRWPVSYFAELADFLSRDFKAAIIFIGTEAERPVIEEVRQKMQQESFDFCGRTTLKELGALMENLKLFISNDSGPAHLAAALGVNTLVLFGPTSPEATAPRGRAVKIIKKSVGCQVPCYKLDCRDNICLKGLSVDTVYSEARKILVNG
jgi:ADP-heptose:LPS heptosyltransferase